MQPSLPLHQAMNSHVQKLLAVFTWSRMHEFGFIWVDSAGLFAWSHRHLARFRSLEAGSGHFLCDISQITEQFTVNWDYFQIFSDMFNPGVQKGCIGMHKWYIRLFQGPKPWFLERWVALRGTSTPTWRNFTWSCSARLKPFFQWVKNLGCTSSK